MRTGESHANADRDPDSNSHTDSYAYSDSNGYAYTDCYAYGDSNGYTYADSYAYGDSNGYAYADSYGYGNGHVYANAYDPAETKPDTKAISDTAASSVEPTRKRLCGNSRENLASSPAKVD